MLMTELVYRPVGLVHTWVSLAMVFVLIWETQYTDSVALVLQHCRSDFLLAELAHAWVSLATAFVLTWETTFVVDDRSKEHRGWGYPLVEPAHTWVNPEMVSEVIWADKFQGKLCSAVRKHTDRIHSPTRTPMHIPTPITGAEAEPSAIAAFRPSQI